MLGIKDPHVDVWGSGEDENGLWFELHTTVRQQTCLQCRKKTKRVHGYRWQVIQSSRMGGQPVTLHLRKLRYRCMTCGHAFFERLFLVEPYQRQTTMLTEEALLFTANLSFTQAGEYLGLTVHRMMHLFDQRQLEGKTVLPRTIAIDEFKGGAGGERFQTVVDTESLEILNILPDRRSETICSYLQSCDTSRLQMVVMDLSIGFKKKLWVTPWEIP